MKLGIIGGGQLGRLLSQAAHELGIKPLVLCPDLDCSASAYASIAQASYDDADAIEAFARDCDVVTYEFENVPAECLKRLQQSGKLRPGVRALEVSQDRLVEKRFLSQLEIPTAACAPIDSREDAQRALETLGLPLILKTRRLGYDGKGQARVLRPEDLFEEVTKLGERDLIAEAVVDFERELSIVAVRDASGSIEYYPLGQNEHREGTLAVSAVDPTRVPAAVQASAESHVHKLMQALDYVGTLGLELFDTADGLVANEFAPRVHNSGHWSIEANEASQFENHVRAVCGLPLGSTQLRGPTVMINFIGQIPERDELLRVPRAHLHDYEKAPRPGRKVGHLTLSNTKANQVPDWLMKL